MDKAQYRSNAYALLYLIRCVLNNKMPSKKKLDRIDLSGLLAVAKAHSLTAIAAYALESAGIYDKDFEEEKYLCIRRNLIMDHEREQVIEELEKAGIWYMPLKGSVIKDMYPDMGMRQMADNDILVDETRMADVKAIMESLRFETDIFGQSHQDVYKKPPVSNFEMHSRLLEPRYGKLYKYLIDVKEKLIKDDDNEFGYHFSDDDLYIYFLIHEYKHFSEAGTGLRSLVDTYVILKHLDGKLDSDYISPKCQKLGIADFERSNREAAMKLFDCGKLTKSEQELLDIFIFSGTYGNFETRIKMAGAAHKTSKVKYIFERLKISEDALKEFYPFFYKHKALRPLLYAWRLINKAIFQKDALMSEIMVLTAVKTKTKRKQQKFSYKIVLKSIAAKISASSLGVPFLKAYDAFIMAEYHILCAIWKVNEKPMSKAQRRYVAKNVTFIYKSFERQYMAKRLFDSIQKHFPGARVIIADDSEKPLIINSKFAKVIQLPFNSGLSYGLKKALAEVNTRYTFKMDDDELLTPLSKIYEQVMFLEKHPETDIVGIQALSAPFCESPQKMAKAYEKHDMKNAIEPLIIPHMTKVDASHLVVGKCANVFLARTEKYRTIGYDENIRMIDHHEFFYRAAGNIVSSMDTTAFVFHYHNWFDGHYAKFRNDTYSDAEHIRRKHGERYYKG